MDSGLHHKKRMNVKSDRLSNLPDDIIHKILYFFDIKHAIKTSVLSSRWRYMWTSMPYLNFSNESFPSLRKFSTFVTRVLSRRNNETNVSSFKLSFCGKHSQALLKRILNYAFSHNVQQVTLTYLLRQKIVFPLCLLSSHSLEQLTLIGLQIDHSTTPSSTWELPALKTLHLDNVTLSDHASDKFSGFFSKCTNLKNLTLTQCHIWGTDGINICLPQLSNLILKNAYYGNVERLKVIISDCLPSLENVSLVLDRYNLQFISDSLPSLEKVDLCICDPYEKDAPKIVDLLQQFHDVKFLTLNLEIIEALSSSVNLISNQPSLFAKLKSLRIYPVKIELWQAQRKINVSTVVKNYLLDSSPNATFTMVSREESRAVRNTRKAQKCMAELQVLLDQEKAKINRAHMDHLKTQIERQKHKAKMHDQGKAQVETKGEQEGMEMPLHIGGKMAQVKRCWEDLNVQIQAERSRVEHVFSKLKDIEQLLTELPASKRVEMEPCFSSLCAEANTVMNDVISCMKVHCNTKRSRLSVYFHELAKASQTS